MKYPNGFGSVIKLSGKRRRPYAVRITTGWEINEQTGAFRQGHKYIGYYKTQREAHTALIEFRQNPYNIDQDIKFEEVWQRWSADKFPTISASNVNGYKASYAVCTPLYKMKFAELRLVHLQGVVDHCGKNYPTLRKLKVLFNQLYTYAMQNDICQKDYSQYVDIAKHREKGQSDKHQPFTETEIAALWQNTTRNRYVSTILMLIYSGVRVSELLNLKKENVHLQERYFDVVQSKTEAGIRKVPIAEKVYPFFQEWFDRAGEYLITNLSGEYCEYYRYRDTYWTPLMKELDMNHLPHDTRHTTVSLLVKAEVNPTLIKRIVGHSGAMNLTEKVYTHFEVQQLIDAINQI